MELIRKEIKLDKKAIDIIYNGFVFKENDYNVITSVKINESQIISINFIKNIGTENRVIVSLIDNKNFSEKVIAVFEGIINVQSLLYISFVKDDYFFMFETNITKIVYNYKYAECINGITHIDEKDTYLYVLLNFVKNIDDKIKLEKIEIFVCSNIASMSKYISGIFLQKTDYLGFDELYAKSEYQTLISSTYKRTEDMMSFLIYCLKCIKDSTKNVYTLKEISDIGENIITSF